MTDPAIKTQADQRHDDHLGCLRGVGGSVHAMVGDVRVLLWEAGDGLGNGHLLVVGRAVLVATMPSDRQVRQRPTRKRQTSAQMLSAFSHLVAGQY